MLKRKYIVSCMLLYLCLCFVIPIELKAKNNIKYMEKKIDGTFVRKIAFSSVSISKGKYYSLKRFVSILKYSKHHDVSCVRSDMKEDKKAVLSGKGLTIRKNSFKAAKTGIAQLNIKINGSSYVFPLRVAEPYYQMNFHDVSKISLTKPVMGKSTTVFIEKTDTIKRIMEEINRARYSFDVEYSVTIISGFDGYWVGLYSEDGRLLEYIGLCTDMIIKSRAYWTADRSATAECFDYMNSVYNEVFSQLPEHVRDC